jgi:CRP/FNR family transcriptional regulator, cyclic AMP receptor protein
MQSQGDEWSPRTFLRMPRNAPMSRRHQEGMAARGGVAVAGVTGHAATEDARRLLGECFLFRELDTEECKVLFARVRLRSYAAGETIFLMGSAGDSMMAVLSGSVRISVPSPDGKEIVLAILQAQEVLGEMALLDGKERTADARAMAECTLAVLERRAVLSFLDRHPHVWPKLAAVLCSRLRNTNQHIAELALLELPARLAKALLRFGNVDGRLDNGRAPLKVQLSQRELGNVCGATRESINKCLGGWQRRGIVQVEESLVTIANQTALEELAELAPW